MLASVSSGFINSWLFNLRGFGVEIARWICLLTRSLTSGDMFTFAQKQWKSPKQTAHPFGVRCFVFWDFVIAKPPAGGNVEGEGYSYDWCTGEHPISPPKKWSKESLSTWYVMICSPPWPGFISGHHITSRFQALLSWWCSFFQRWDMW